MLEVLGSPCKTKCDVAIVVQGKYIPQITSIVFSEFLNRNSNNIVLICATYYPGKEGDISFLSNEEQFLIALGILVFIFVKEPSKEDFPEFWATNHANQNLQRLTSFTGIHYAHDLNIEYTLKIRSDSFLGKLNVIDCFLSDLKQYPPNPEKPSIKIKGRIIVSGQGTIIDEGFKYPFHVRDHWYFAHTTDLLAFFNTKGSWRNGKGIAISCPESAITCVWTHDIGIESKCMRELLGRYFVVHDAVEVEQVRLTQTPSWLFDHSEYNRHGKEYLRKVYLTADSRSHVTTHEEWKQLVI